MKTEKHGAPETASETAPEWDTERRHQFAPMEGQIRGTTMNFTAPLWAAMKEAWGGVVAAIRTSTDVKTGEVTVAKAESVTEAGAVMVRPVKTFNAASCSWWRPLKKLGLDVPGARQLNVTPFIREMKTVGTVFVFPMWEAHSVPRELKKGTREHKRVTKRTQARVVAATPTTATPATDAPATHTTAAP